jgi:Fe-S-cluster containining protein
MPGFPYKMNPTEKLVETVVKEAREVLDGSPETTCCHKAECCKAGCPNMYFVEFLNIRRNHVEKLPRAERTLLTIDCIRRYLWNVDHKNPKPCVFLGQDNMCKIYDHRHIKCRLYGVIPQWTYVKNANAVAKENGVALEEMPLATQCPFVKIKPKWQDRFPDNKVPEDTIKKWERKLRELDRRLGLPPDMQDEGYGFLTYHDWHLMFEMGAEWMESLTKLRTQLTDEQKEHFIVSLKIALDKQD